MSYNAKHSISIICPNKAVANEITEYFRDYICRSDDEAWADGKTVGVCTFGDIDNEDLAMLTAKYPGTFLTDEYYGEDYEIGVIYARYGKYYEDSAEIQFPAFDPSKLPEPEHRLGRRVVRKSFECDFDLAKYTDSMLFDSGTGIASAEYIVGGEVFSVHLEVRGEVAVTFDGITYHAPSEFPDELKERIRNNPGWWDTYSPSGEGNDDQSGDIYCGMNNWFEAIWNYRGYCDGVMFEEDISKCTLKDIEDFLDEVAMNIIGNTDMDVLKKNCIAIAEELGWKVTEYDSDIEFSQHSPAGEDFSFTVRKVSMPMIDGEIAEYAKEFEADEHALSVYQMNGAPGIRDCLTDADEIQNMLDQLSTRIGAEVESWCEEYGIS